MNLELQKKLIEKYPKIFPIKTMTKIYPMAMFGFECSDGWYNILYTLCGRIQSYIDYRERFNQQIIERNKKEDPEGQINQQMLLEYIPQVVASQVKEKYGTLRFYYDGGDEQIEGMVTMAEAITEFTCERCGNVGKLRGKSWLYTACDEHTKAEDKE